MSLNRTKLAGLGAAGVALLISFGVFCCSRSETPAVRTEQPHADVAEVTERPREPVPPAETPTSESGSPPQPAPSINVDHPEAPEPPTPHYVAVAEEIKPAEPSKIRATIVSPTKLVIETDNVKRLRVTREGTVLSRNRSVALRVDGQGIEWTRDYIAVELERSPAGEWTVVRRRPAKP